MGRLQEKVGVTAKEDRVGKDEFDELQAQLNFIIKRIDMIFEEIDKRTIDYYHAYIFTPLQWHVPGILVPYDPILLLGLVKVSTVFDPLLVPPPIPAVNWYDGVSTVSWPIPVLPVPSGTHKIEKVIAHLGLAPTMGNVTLDVNLNGVSIFLDQDHRPQFRVGELFSENGVPFDHDVTTFRPVVKTKKKEDADLLSIDIDETDGVASDLTVLLILRQELEDAA